MSQPDLVQLIDKYSCEAGPTPFLEHIDYFRNKDGKLDKRSIASKWSDLSKESYVKTMIKAHITINGANYVNQKQNNGCPWKYQFESSAEIMPCLKHSRDSDIVNRDGSINVEKLKDFMTSCFEYDPDNELYFVTKSTIDRKLKDWQERDKDLEERISCMLPAWATVAEAEWNDFFLNFTSCWYINPATRKHEQAVDAETFLQFYFNSKKLYDRVLKGDLPRPLQRV